MRISELQKYLAAVKRKHGDIELIEQRFSDYGPMGELPAITAIEESPSYDCPPRINWAVVQALPQQGGEYLMRYHPSISVEEREKLGYKTYLLYKGN